jgi:hypothetical protein
MEVISPGMRRCISGGVNTDIVRVFISGSSSFFLGPLDPEDEGATVCRNFGT